MRLGPTDELLKGRDERLAGVGETILHARRHLGIDLSPHEMACLQLLERFGEHLLRAVAHVGVQLVEAHYTRLTPVQGVQYEHRPLVAEAADDLSDGTSEILGINFFLHISTTVVLVYTTKVTKSDSSTKSNWLMCVKGDLQRISILAIPTKR